MLPPIRVEDGRVPQPEISRHCLLRSILIRWATRFTPNEALQVHLVEKTISEILREFPVIDDTSPIDVELFSTMRRVMLREFGVQGLDAPSSGEDARVNDQNNDQ